MKKTKWVAAFAAACALALLAAGCKNSSDDSEEPGAGYDAAEWLIDDDTVIKYRGTATAVTIPEGITCIGERAFYGCAGLKSVAIPDGVAIIEDEAFSGCASLTSVTIPDSMAVIGWSAFYGCASLRSVALGKGVTSIGSSAFNGCASLASVTYAGTLEQWCAMDNDTNLMSYARSVTMSDGTDLKTMTSLEIPEGVTSIGYSAFYGCKSLTDVKIPGSVAEIKGYAFSRCTSLTGATIPEGVTSIGNYAFNGCESLASVKIPEGVTSIGDYAFSGCSSLASVEIPDSVTSIGGYAFYGCSSLASVEIPDSVTSIGGDAFYECSSLEKVTYNGTLAQWCGIDREDYDANPLYNGKAVLYIGDEPLTVAEIPDGVTEIKGYAFCNCTSLTDVIIPEGVTSIGDDAFRGCSSLEKVTYKGTLAQWCGIDWESSSANPLNNSNAVLYINDKELTVAEILDGVTEIKDYAFYYYRSLTDVTIPEGVTSIGRSAFSECSSLESVTIPASVKSVSSGGYSYSAFYGCYNLKNITYAGTEEQWKKIKGIDNCGLSDKTVTGKDGETWTAQ